MAEKITVTLRVEGKTKTLYEGPVSTCGHSVSTPSGGTHHCDGTNGGANPCTGPTCTTALDDGNKTPTGKFNFDGPFESSKDDFDITTIGGDKATGTDSWAKCVNFKPNNALGCHIPVKAGDQVLWAYVTDKTKHYLKLTGPTVAFPSIPYVFVVTDGATGDPIKGASIPGHAGVSDNLGKLQLVFKKLGSHPLKAEKKDDSIRSNTWSVNVVVAHSDAWTVEVTAKVVAKL